MRCENVRVVRCNFIWLVIKICIMGTLDQIATVQQYIEEAIFITADKKRFIKR